MFVAIILPGGDLAFECLFVWNAPAQALSAQNGEFGFGQIEPASMFGCIMPFEPQGEAARLGGWESGVKRGRRMRVEIVLEQPDLFGVGKVRVGQLLEHLA